MEWNKPNPDNIIGMNKYEYRFDLATVTTLIVKNNIAHILCNNT